MNSELSYYLRTKQRKISRMRIQRMMLVAGLLFLSLYWYSATHKTSAEAENITTTVSGPFIGKEFTGKENDPVVKKVAVTPQVTTVPAPVKKVKSDEQKIKEYLTAYGSPLVGYTASFMKQAKKYNVDPKIMVAISVTESSAGKSLCHGEGNGFNPFGLLYRKRLNNNVIVRRCIEFSNYDQSITYLAKLLGTTYKSNNKTTIATIGTSYDPGNPEWVKSTTKYYNLINNR